MPADLGRLYQRTATTDPSTYRQQPEVRIDRSCQLPANGTNDNDDWRRAVDELEDELLACAVQVQDCIGCKQKAPIKGSGKSKR